MVRGYTRKVPTVPIVKLPSFNASIHNRFDIEVVDANNGAVKQKAQSFNTICNNLWSRLCSTNSYFDYIHYGSGSGTPSESDTSLFSFIGYKALSGEESNVNFETGVAYIRRSIQINASEEVGKTISEVGIAYDKSSSTLCTHAMLEDMNGNKVSIVKTDTDVINIYATIYVHFNKNGYGGGPIRLYENKGGYGGNTILNFICGINGYGSLPSRAWFMNNYAMAGNRTYIYPDSDNVPYKDNVKYTYDITNRKVICTIPRLESSDVNIGGIRRICLGGYYAVVSNRYSNAYIQLDVGGTWYPYTNISKEAVGTGDGSTVDFALAFPYAHDAKIYINGIETTDFTLDYGPKTTNPKYQCLLIRPESSMDNHIPDEQCINYYFTGCRIFYNPAYEIGLATFYVGANVDLQASNDLSTWELITAETASNRTFSIPTEFAHYKYWKATNKHSTNSQDAYPNSYASTYTTNHLHFNTPPADGAVITADYKTDTIAKDANHVFDMTFELCFNNYTEA